MKDRLPTESKPATQKEIEEALAALTENDLLRLGKIAWFRHRALGSRAAGRHESDVLSDAIIAALEGRRKWIKGSCDFVGFLAGVMRSLTSHIRDGKAADAFDEIAPNLVNERDDVEDSLDRLATPAADDPENRLRAHDLDGQIRERFKDDPIVLLVYEAFLDRMKPVEIRSCLEITEKEYNAAAKRLRRTARGFTERRSR